MQTRIKRALLAGMAAVLLAVLFPSAGLTHATLLRSDPADGSTLATSPREVHLWFDEPISSQFSSAQLFDANSNPVDIKGVLIDPTDPTGLIISLPEIPDGVYSLLYKVLSETDGHFSQGLLVFGVGEDAEHLAALEVHSQVEPPPPAPEVILRWGNFALLAGLIGAAAVIRLVLSPALEQAREQKEVITALMAARQRALRIAAWSAGLGLLAGFGMLLWQTLSLEASLPEGASTGSVAWQILTQMRWGWLWVFRQVVLLSLAGLFWRFSLRTPPPAGSPGQGKKPAPDRFFWPLAGLLLAGLLAVQALSSHASGLQADTALAVIADALHLLAASLWVGGLLTLALSLLPILRQPGVEFRALAQAGWRPFSRMAAISVGVLFATGLYSTGRQVASLDALLTTLYGQALMAKIGVLFAVGAVGLLNSMLLHPGVAAPIGRLLGRPPGWAPFPLKRLPALIILEGSLGVMAFLIAGLVTAAPAPRGSTYTVVPEEVPQSLSQSVGDLLITLSVKPNRPGQNVFTVFTKSTRRPPPAEIGRVLLRFTYLEQDSGRETAAAEEIEDGRYLIGGNYLSLAGHWQVDVVVRRPGLEDSVASFDWVVAPPGEARPEVVSKYPWEGILSPSAAGLLLIVLTISAGVWIGRKRRLTKTIPEAGFSQNRSYPA